MNSEKYEGARIAGGLLYLLVMGTITVLLALEDII